MDAGIDAGETDEAGDGKHNPFAAAIKNSQDDGDGGAVGGVAGRHAAGVAATGDEFGVLELLIGTLTSDGFLNGPNDYAVANRESEGEEEKADAGARIAEDQKEDARDEGNSFKVGATVEDINEPIEKRISGRLIDQPEEGGIDVLQHSCARE